MFRAHNSDRPVCDCVPATDTATHSLGSILASARPRSARELLAEWAEKDLMLKRTAAQWAPWATAAGALALAAMHEIAAHLAGPQATASSVGTVALLAGVAADAIRTQRRWAPWLYPAPERRRWALLCLTAGVTWTIAAFLLGLSWEAAAALAVGTLVLARGYWHRHRIADPDAPRALPSPPPPPPAPEPEETPTPDQIVAYWDANVAITGGPVPYAVLTPLEAITAEVETEDGHAGAEIGMRYVVALSDQSGITIESAVAQIPAIAQCLHTPRSNIVIEEFPPTEDDPAPDPNFLKLEVITDSPIAKPVRVTEPRYRARTRTDPDSGESFIEAHVDCGPYANGDGQSAWRTYTRDSMWGGFILGGIGSGKSALMNLIGLALLSSGHTVIWYLDGQNEASSAFLARFADWSSAGREDWEPMLAALEEIASARADENADLGIKGFTPSPERPGLAVIIDECQFVFHPDLAKRWEALQRIGRKVGIALIAATQAAQIDSFGGLSPLKDALEAGNCKVLRCTGKVQQHLVSGLNMDPTALPEIPGYGYSVASGLDGFGRTAPFRGAYHDNFIALAEHLGLEPCPLDPLAQGAANIGSDNRYANRHATREENQEERRRRLEAYRQAAEGADPDAAPAPHATRPAGLFDALPGTDNDEVLGALGDLPEDITGYIQHLSDTLGERAQDGALDDPAAWRPGMSISDVLDNFGEVHRQAFEAIRDAYNEDRTATSAEIQKRTGKGKSRTHEVTRDLVNTGLVACHGRGQWSLSTGAAEEHEGVSA